MSEIANLPELRGLGTHRQSIRIPDEIDVPLTDRVKRLIDTAPFRRLSQISQLGLVSLVYPAANHTRFEHSLGVYRMALLFLQHLANDTRFAKIVRVEDAELLLVAALLHDVGHWPFCHPIEDIHLEGVPEHEEFASRFILDSDIADTVRRDWSLQPQQVVDLLQGRVTSPSAKLLSSILSGPIDIDKMDYLQRDSLHAGVPYGRNFDHQRLIGSLCLNESGDGLAISDKGRTAAEMMVFARYVMFSEVYWHHAVRSATAMLQRAFSDAYKHLDLDAAFCLTELPFVEQLRLALSDSTASELLDGLFGARRQLYKRLAQFSFLEDQEMYSAIARRPYPWLCQCAEAFGELLADETSMEVKPHEILFDAPPTKLEVQFNVDVFDQKASVYRSLGDVSPVVRTLAVQQFDDYVKRVRIFLHPRLITKVNKDVDIRSLLSTAIKRCD